jgi:signal transduction histidine kinase
MEEETFTPSSHLPILLMLMATARKNFGPKAYIFICVISLAPFVVMGISRHFNLLKFIELKTLDGRQLLAHDAQQVSDQIALIAIDDKTEGDEGLGLLSSWPPDLYAALLGPLQTADTEAIGLVMWFNREWQGEQFLPSSKLFVIQPYSFPDPATHNSLPEAKSWSRLPHSLQAAQSSFSWFPLSPSDGIHRLAQLVSVFGPVSPLHGAENGVKDSASTDYLYSIEILMLCQTYGISSASIKIREGFWRGQFLELPLPTGMPLRIPIDPHGRLSVRFVRDASAFKSTSYVDALEAIDTDPAQFRRDFDGRIVLVGVTTANIPTASTPLGEMPALALRANLLNTLLNRNFIWQLSGAANLLYLFCLAIFSTIAAILIHRFRCDSRWMLLTASGLFLLHVVFVIAMFVRFNAWLEATASGLAIILAGVMNTLFLAHLRLRDFYFQLQTTQNQLVQSEKQAMFGVMSARVRHEVRNALNVIRGPAEIIRTNFLRQDPMNLRDRPKEIVDRMDEIIGWVMKLDEMIENEFRFFQNSELNLQSQALEPILFAAQNMIQPLIDENQIQVTLNWPSKMPSIPLDADKMRVVFTNLMKNACQAMPKGGTLAVDVKFSPTTNRSSNMSKAIMVIITDTGSGISADELKRIFEPFHTTKPRGLGLGLVNVKNIVEEHGGWVHVESELGVGTTFFIELPYQ